MNAPMLTARALAARIDHTCLVPGATAADIERLCEEALAWGFHAVCVAPARVALAAARLEGSPVRVGGVVGFPHGNALAAIKAAEAEAVLAAGAREIDMVMHLGDFKDGRHDLVLAEIAGVAERVRRVSGALVKVILETGALTPDEIAAACAIAERAGAHFVKTATGFGPGGATVEAVRRMRECVGERLGVKAAGGIRDYESACAMLAAGATRIGASASVAIVRGARDASDQPRGGT
jgi:deoxyribose-phosphate aldolase